MSAIFSSHILQAQDRSEVQHNDNDPKSKAEQQHTRRTQGQRSLGIDQCACVKTEHMNIGKCHT